MKSTSFTSIVLLALVPFTAYAQRITGDSACVNSCYQISVAVTQCPDLTDSGVISCICPNATQVAQLDQCHGCITSLQGVTDLESNSINTLYGACSNNGTASSASGSPSSTGSTGTLGSNNAAQTSNSAAAGTPTGGSTGAGIKNVNAIGGVVTVAVAALAAFATL